jgi:hypothetical protein
MKKMLTGIVCLAILSCNRNKDQEFTSNIPPQQTSQLIPWLEKQKANVASDSGKQAITKLEASLLISESVIRPSGYGKKVMITPIKKEPSTREEQSSTTFLLSQLNSEGRIIRSNIVTYTPETAAAPVKMPADLFENYYGDGRMPDVKLTFRSNTGRLLFETAFRNGDLYSHSYPEIKNRANHSGELTENECVEWYWQTYVNGVLVSEVYLGTTCGPYVEEGSGGGATGGEEITEVEVLRSPQWTVAQNPRIGSNGVGEIKSFETMRGKRNSTYPGGGYFTQNSHSWSYCNFCMDPSDNWSETSHSSTHSTLNATTTVTGDLHYENDEYFNLSGTKTWTFTQVFN